MAHTVLGGVIGVGWLVLPGMTINTDVPVAISADASDTVARTAPGAPASAAPPEEDDSSATDLVLPLAAVAAAAALAGYGYVRRTRRARSRTTPGGSPTPPSAPPLTELDEQSRALLVEADDWVRAGREELAFAEARFGSEDVAPFTAALRDAEAELSAAFAIRRRYDDGVPADEDTRRHVLAGIVGRCQEAGRRLDAEAAGFDRLRALEREPGAALSVAEARFRELAGRTASAEATLKELTGLYPPSAAAPVAGYVEQAKDRLVFATTRLNRAHQATDLDDPERAAHHLRAAEGAVAQAAVLLTAVGRLAEELSTAARLVPTALTGAEAELTGVRGRPVTDAELRAAAPATSAGQAVPAGPADERTSTAGAGTPAGPDTSAPAQSPPHRRLPLAPDLPPGELRARARHADAVLAVVREDVTSGPYDPLDALRRIVGAVGPLAVGRAGVLSVAGMLVARSAVALADGFVQTHRGAVGCAARLRLADAGRVLAAEPPDHLTADILAREARDLADQDVRLHGNPVAGAAEHAGGAAGAVLGGILLGGTPDGGPPPSFGGPRTRARHGLPSAQEPSGDAGTA